MLLLFFALAAANSNNCPLANNRVCEDATSPYFLLDTSDIEYIADDDANFRPLFEFQSGLLDYRLSIDSERRLNSYFLEDDHFTVCPPRTDSADCRTPDAPRSLFRIYVLLAIVVVAAYLTCFFRARRAIEEEPKKPLLI